MMEVARMLLVVLLLLLTKHLARVFSNIKNEHDHVRDDLAYIRFYKENILINYFYLDLHKVQNKEMHFSFFFVGDIMM